MPVTKRFPIAELMQACRALPRATRGRRVFIEYLLLAGVNDSARQAGSSSHCSPGGPSGFHVNLIAYNPTGSEYRVAVRRRLRAAFRGELERGAIGTVLPRSRGRDIEAACGQLVMKGIPAAPQRAATAGAAHAPAPRSTGSNRDDGRPASMRAWVIRPDRLGEPRDAMRLETVEVPEPGRARSSCR